MSYLTILALSFGLAMDAVAVAMVYGFHSGSKKWLFGIKISFFFAFFQGAMPVVGYSIGYSFYPVIENYDHWVAFFALTTIGGHMIYESVRSGNMEYENRFDINSFKTLILLSFSTSLDALISGISLLSIGLKLLISVSIISVVTFLLSLIAYMMGKKLYFLFGKKVEILGGVVLILIGLKILLEHL